MNSMSFTSSQLWLRLQQWPVLMRISLASLRRTPWASATVAGCVMLVVLVLLAFQAMARGFADSQKNLGSPELAVLLAAEASSESGSRFGREALDLLANAPGLQRDAQGRLLLSPEFSMTVAVGGLGSARQNLNLRGLSPQGMALREGLQVTAGRMLQPGRAELLVGRRLAAQQPSLKVGAQLRLAGRDWTVVGHYGLAANLFETELLADLGAVQAAYGRHNQYQSIRARLAGPDPEASLGQLSQFASEQPRLGLAAQTERQFYAQQAAGTQNLLLVIGWPLAAVLALGTVAGTLNTLSIAVLARARSLRVLHQLGFASDMVALCVLCEALLLSLAGALLGGLIAWLAFDGRQGSTVGTGFTNVHFDWQLDPQSLLLALALAMVIGALGGLLPAWRSLHLR
jgi:putative ABC transport system permease protein